MPVKLNSSGGGSVTIDVPSTASAYTLTAPAANATLITTGSSGQIIPKAALPAGTILQVVNGYMPAQIEGSFASNTDCFSVTITPTFASSRILVEVSMAGCLSRATGTYGRLWIAKGSSRTVVSYLADYVGGYSTYGYEVYPNHSCIDSPSTTSAITYYVMALRTDGASTLAVNHYRGGGTNDPLSYASSRMTLTEIAT